MSRTHINFEDERLLELTAEDLKGIETMQSQVAVKEALIITRDEEDDLKVGRLDVAVKPAWKWALEQAL